MSIYIYTYHPFVHEAIFKVVHQLALRHRGVNDVFGCITRRWLDVSMEGYPGQETPHMAGWWLKDVISGVLTSSKHLDFNFKGRIPRTFPNPWSFHHANDGCQDLGKGFTKERGAIQKRELHFIHQSWFFIFAQTLWKNFKLTTSLKIILELIRQKSPKQPPSKTHRRLTTKEVGDAFTLEVRPPKGHRKLQFLWNLSFSRHPVIPPEENGVLGYVFRVPIPNLRKRLDVQGLFLHIYFFLVGLLFKTPNPQKKIMGVVFPSFSFSFTIFWCFFPFFLEIFLGFSLFFWVFSRCWVPTRPSQLPFLGPPNWQRCVAARCAAVKSPLAFVEIGTQRGQGVDEESLVVMKTYRFTQFISWTRMDSWNRV